MHSKAKTVKLVKVSLIIDCIKKQFHFLTKIHTLKYYLFIFFFFYTRINNIGLSVLTTKAYTKQYYLPRFEIIKIQFFSVEIYIYIPYKKKNCYNI